MNDQSPKLELKLNLSPPRDRGQVLSAHESVSSAEISPGSSCLSGEASPSQTMSYSSSPESSPMMLVGCPRCLMYFMLLEEDPKCPKCKSTVLLDVLQEDRTSRLNKQSRTKFGSFTSVT